MIFVTEYETLRGIVQKHIDKVVSNLDKIPQPLDEAIKYSILDGGKRIRPVLFVEVLRLLKKDFTDADASFAVAIECIHTYSLIHDDLPCMDDDDLRRGKPTVHKVFGEAIAVLAGDALLNLAYELLLRGITLAKYKKSYIKAASLIAQLAGMKGMIAGQTADIQLAQGYKNTDLIEYAQKHKTADLIYAAVGSAAIIANASAKEQNALRKFAYSYGLAFQIKDDIDDYNKNISHQIKDSVDIYGIERAKTLLNEKISDAYFALDSISCDTAFLKDLVYSIAAN